MGLLDGKRMLVTGVLMDTSIAFHVARIAQEEGAEVVLTSFGRTMRITQAIAKRLPQDATGHRARRHATPRTSTALADRVREHVDGLDGVLHSIGFAPQARAGRQLPEHRVGRRGDRGARLGVLAEGARRGRAAADGPRRVDRRADVRRDGRLAGVRLDGRGQGGVRVDRALPRAGPRAGGDPRQPGGCRPAPDDGGQVDPGVRGVRESVVDRARRSAGTSRTPSRPRVAASRCCRTGSRRRRGRSSTSTAACTPWAPEVRR